MLSTLGVFADGSCSSHAIGRGTGRVALVVTSRRRRAAHLGDDNLGQHAFVLVDRGGFDRALVAQVGCRPVNQLLAHRTLGCCLRGPGGGDLSGHAVLVPDSSARAVRILANLRRPDRSSGARRCGWASASQVDTLPQRGRLTREGVEVRAPVAQAATDLDCSRKGPDVQPGWVIALLSAKVPFHLASYLGLGIAELRQHSIPRAAAVLFLLAAILSIWPPVAPAVILASIAFFAVSRSMTRG